MSHHFKGLSFTVLHVVNLLGCTLKPTYPVRILYINGSAWKSGSLQNDPWIRRSRKWLPAFDLHLMVLSCSERKAAIWIWWTDGLVSLKRTDFFNIGFLHLGGGELFFFLHQVHYMFAHQPFRVFRFWGFFADPVYSSYTAVCCNVKVFLLLFFGIQLQITIDFPFQSQKVNFLVESKLS